MDEKKNPDPWAIPDIGPETDEKKSGKRRRRL